MLEKIEYAAPLKDPIDGNFGYLYRIFDTDFGSEDWEGRGIDKFSASEDPGIRAFDDGSDVDAVIRCYECKGLDVAHNLYLLNRYMVHTTYTWSDIEEEIQWCCKNMPAYVKYAEEVRQYAKRYDNIKSFW